jgi:hypothetical protein
VCFKIRNVCKEKKIERMTVVNMLRERSCRSTKNWRVVEDGHNEKVRENVSDVK